MKFASTRNASIEVSIKDCLFSPKARDGGLFIPKEELDLRSFLYLMDDTTSFSDIVRIISLELLKDYASPRLIESLVHVANTTTPQLKSIDENLALLELFHGPTGAFQDFPMLYLSTLLRHFNQENRRISVLMASSGDTGAAAAHAFAADPNASIFIVCPKSEYKGLPKNHLARYAGNTRVIAVDGNHDECLKLVNSILSDNNAVERFGLVAATTMNPGRFISQVFYYLFAFNQLKKQANDFFFDIPSGNFGNFTSGLLAWRWGLPVSGFIAANFSQATIKKGHSRKGQKPDLSKLTNNDNFERILSLSAGNPMVINSMIYTTSIYESEFKNAMTQLNSQYNLIVDPYTAVGYAAAVKAREEFLEPNGKIVMLATAHPWKYRSTVKEILGIQLDPPPAIMNLPEGSDARTLDRDFDASISPQKPELLQSLSIFIP